MASSPLISALKAGTMQLQNRIVMAPLTRLRCEPGSEAPREINAEYYAQRSSAGGLIIGEAAYSSPTGRGYVRAPGVSSPAQVEGWKKVISAVHAKQGYFFVQLFHAGRVSHQSMLPQGTPLISASDVKMAGQLYVDGGKKVDYGEPEPATLEQIAQVVKDFAASARAAVDAGADGVEIHAGNGYLLQQFMARKTNLRSDAYGGDVAGRCKLLLEVIDACVAAVGAERMSVKLQPGATFSDLIEPEADVKETLEYLAPLLAQRKLAYVCVSTLNSPPYALHLGLSGPNVSFDVWSTFRAAGFDGVLMANGGLSIESAEAMVSGGGVDLACFGVPFIANANLVDLVAAGVKSAGINHGGWQMDLWYSKDPANDAQGYTDWPLVAPEEALKAQHAAMAQQPAA